MKDLRVLPGLLLPLLLFMVPCSACAQVTPVLPEAPAEALRPDEAGRTEGGYWQQEAFYRMEIDFDVGTHRFDGRQELTYRNNSPDTLWQVYYHLYYNAFQPNSMMDIRSRTIDDPDARVGDRIYRLGEEETGWQKIRTLTQEGEPLVWRVSDTVLEVDLARPLLPGAETRFEMEFSAQVPVQIRRTGRNNAEGIDYSMAQWYPKIAEYDEWGWHAHPYIGREFHGVFGRFDVKITIDRNYVVAATGYLQNPEEVGHGYAPPERVRTPEGEKLTWHFLSDYQHDFMWAADPDYVHRTLQVPDGPLLRFFYQEDPVSVQAPEERQNQLRENWERLPEYTMKAFQYMNEHFGRYPYREFVVVQGADGGMEYIMGTLITGDRDLRGLVSVTVHELIHSWYQGVLANNESYYHWMDEGFTTWASVRVMEHLFGENAEESYASYYATYSRIVQLGLEEPMHRHADHFRRNVAYSVAAYVKGGIFLHQLGYIIGQETLDRTMRRFFDTWKFRHPTGRDFVRVAEKESGIHLQWYYDYWVESTRTIDYGIEEVTDQGEGTLVRIARHGEMPMPLDLEVRYTDGRVEQVHIPLQIMRGLKENENPNVRRSVAEAWPWVAPDYTLFLLSPLSEIRLIEIDPSGRLADINQQNNIWHAPARQ